MEITDAEREEIIRLSEEPDVYERIIDSIAPTIYGFEVAKLAIALQLFSGVTKHLPDGARIRGDVHILLVGDPGTGKCVRGETNVTLADGTRREIRDIVEANLESPKPVDDGVFAETDIPVLSLAEDGSIQEASATKVWKREAPEQMYRVSLSDGSELEITPSHPLFTLTRSIPTAVTGEELSEGTFVAVPRNMTQTADNSLAVPYRSAQSNNAVRVDLPSGLTPGLARLLGYIIAEGYAEIRDDNTAYVGITNEEEAVLEDVETQFAELGLPVTKRPSHPGKSAQEYICNSSEFATFLESLEPRLLEGSAHQRVPEAVFESSEPVRADFLKAYIEGEGHVSVKEREITVATVSDELLKDVRSLLLSLGIRGHFEAKAGDSYRLRISGRDFNRYKSMVGFVSDRKTAASEVFEETPQNTNTDVIPDVGPELQRIRERLALTQSECGIPRSTFQHYERGDRHPGRDSLRAVISTFESRLQELESAHETLVEADWETVECLRQELGISQTDLANGIGVKQTTVSMYSRGEIVPDGGRVQDARAVLRDRIESALAEADSIRALSRLVEGDLAWAEITDIEEVDPDYDWVYDLEVEGTHSYLSNNVLSHNSQILQYIRHIAPRSVYTSGKGSSAAGLTAAAVRDDFGDGQQWSLEAGALVLADKGVAAVDELDKMAPDDRSAMHEALEQQSISISKAGINATLKSRCALLGAANPELGRFDRYETPANQIDLEPALISRFDLIFTVTDQPDQEKDANLAEHILRTNYAGELNTHRNEVSTSNVSAADVDTATESVSPAIEPDLMRKYIAYARSTCFPTMTDAAESRIRDFYVDLRAQGTGEDSPVPVTARKLEAIVRLAEASARVRLSDTVETEDAERALDIVDTTLKEIGMDPETGQYDADVIETGQSKSQRDRIRSIKELISEIEAEFDEGAPIDEVLARAEEIDMDRSKAEHEIDKLKQQGEVYEPTTEHLRTT
ncbi:MAG: helix-turn-helix domain-containing protein [Halodesulfurarchaeum sp.]|nr:helix-turn-helix domain-containing protein [Halodesulfurarchaeum sp.]